jgi:carbon monoxide dehydrogenase subunit G
VKLEQSFDVAAPLERVWEALIDVERVAPCLPGASVTSRNEDGSYNGAFSVKIGPTSASYAGKLEMEQVDEQAHVATMQAHGTDKRGQGGARATIVSRLAPADGEATRVEVVTDYHITGRLARFGRGGMIEDISERLLREFAQCLQTRLADEPDGSSIAVGAEATSPSPNPVNAADQPTLVKAPSGPAAGPEGVGDQPTRVGAISDPPTGPQGAGDAMGALDGTGEPVGAPAGADGSEFRAPTPTASQPPEATEPLDGLSLMASVLWSRVRRNPAPIIAAVIGFLVAVVLLRRPRR